jgi:predicted AAA+ superfamily ATPase
VPGHIGNDLWANAVSGWPMVRPEYTPRLIDERLERLFAQLPAILITGPRATGKTTTAGQTAGATFLEKLAADDLDRLAVPPGRPDLRGYVELPLRSGYPGPTLRLSGEARDARLSGSLEQLLTRDAESVAGHRYPTRLRRYFEATALSTVGRPEHKTLYGAAGVDRKTALAYGALLTNLFVLELVPAWATNRLSRSSRRQSATSSTQPSPARPSDSTQRRS